VRSAQTSGTGEGRRKREDEEGRRKREERRTMDGKLDSGDRILDLGSISCG
jgi:hypothetical protein